MNRVIAYIDGNNLHYRTRSLRSSSLLWCDVEKLVRGFLETGESLESTRYYTARPAIKPHKRHDPENAENRWKRHIKLLQMRNVEIFKGTITSKINHIKFYELLSKAAMDGDIPEDYLKKVLSPRLLQHYQSEYKGSFEYRGWVEKKTDVRLATDLIGHAYQNKYEIAFVISADSDLIPAIEHVLDNHSKLKIRAITPPGHHSKEIEKLSDKYSSRLEVRRINKADLEKAQLPDSVPLKNGKFLTRPVKYS